ncbi:hypothetical protein HS088_TW07G00864 [Tripterygium wilfordii]|uniref:Uncharacterized protein n=1 Tax=Tripterygium wilfordii TaxID=458696 RepID=A0A7J7DG20_TRIWF|nr:hypothetical protein HS088_TW07G00864 [Tripterygium wilfordii]
MKRMMMHIFKKPNDQVSSVTAAACAHSVLPALQSRSYFSWPGCWNSYTVPTWLLNLQTSSSGTGVFIPQIVRSRNNRPGRCLTTHKYHNFITAFNAFHSLITNTLTSPAGRTKRLGRRGCKRRDG